MHNFWARMNEFLLVFSQTENYIQAIQSQSSQMQSWLNGPFFGSVKWLGRDWGESRYQSIFEVPTR